MEVLRVGDCYRLVGSQHNSAGANRKGHPCYLLGEAPPQRKGRKTVRLFDGETFEEFYAESRRLRPFDDADFEPLTEDVPAPRSLEAEVDSHLFMDDIKAAFDEAGLKENERRAVILRTGLYDGKKWTLAEAGEFLGVSQERVRQLEGKGLHKLRSYRATKHLRPYLD